MDISGHCHPKFDRVRQEFERSFATGEDVGASLCLTVEGETVVDLWGGIADVSTGAPWERDTVAMVFSCTKAATALCAHILVSRGQLDLDAPVAEYWPEFAQAGKGDIPVRMLLNHQAGLPALRRPVPEDAFCIWELMTTALAAEEPFWEPGTRVGYHWYTFGWLVGEVIRRVSGLSVGQFFAREVAGPLGLDFWIGLPEEVEPRVAPVIMLGRPTGLDPDSIAGLVWYNDGGFLDPGRCDTRVMHAAEIPAINGITNARGLAGMYAPLACGTGLVGPDDVARMAAVASATEKDATQGGRFRYTLGYQKFGPGNPLAVPETGFGHAGMGGAVGFADPGAKLSFGYVMNKLSTHDRAARLLDATYQALGYRSKASGGWL